MRLACSPVHCLAALGCVLLFSGCATNGEPALTTAPADQPTPEPGEHARVEVANGPPGPRVSRQAGPYIRTGKPQQALIIDTSPLKGEIECCVSYEDQLKACAPNCDVYRRTRLERRPTRWIASQVRNGRVTISYAKNQCGGAPTEIVVNGRRIEVFRYVAIDPVSDDHMGLDGCTLGLGYCESDPCKSTEVRVNAPDGAKLDHGGLPPLPVPCSPWPRCQTISGGDPANVIRSPIATAAKLAQR